MTIPGFGRWLSRRELFRGGAAAAIGSLLSGGRAAAAPLRLGKDIYQSIGVRPVINCKGTFTIISGLFSFSIPL